VVWELIFMMLILKIPILYLCLVVWWAIKAEPRPLEGAALPVGEGPEPQPPRRWRRRRTRMPRGGPARTFARVRAPVRRTAEAGR
jgi:hypothetical protein